MAVRLESTIKRFVGKSGDVKPFVGQVQDDGSLLKSADLPPGSTFRITDTFRVSVWDGTGWIDDSLQNNATAQLYVSLETLEVLQELRDETRATRLGIQELTYAGNQTQDDLLELSQAIRDQQNEES